VALLGRSRPPLQALAAVPVGKPGTRLGLALLYFIEGDALPSPEALEHLALLAGLFELRLETHASPEVILLDPADLVALNAEPELRLAAG